MTDKKLRQRLLKKSLDPNFAQKKAPCRVLFLFTENKKASIAHF
jgi:hypothetical protein